MLTVVDTCLRAWRKDKRSRSINGIIQLSTYLCACHHCVIPRTHSSCGWDDPGHTSLVFLFLFCIDGVCSLFCCSVVLSPLNGNINITGPAATQNTGLHCGLLYDCIVLSCCLLYFYFNACCSVHCEFCISFSVILASRL